MFWHSTHCCSGQLKKKSCKIILLLTGNVPKVTSTYTNFAGKLANAYYDLCALWDVVASNFNSTRGRTPGNPKGWWIHTESFEENLRIQQQ